MSRCRCTRRSRRHPRRPPRRRRTTAPRSGVPARCTYLNLASVSTCDLCDARRPGAAAVTVAQASGSTAPPAPAREPAAAAAAATEQICPMCTFSNSPTATKCELCDGPLPGLGGSAPTATVGGGLGQSQDDEYGDDDFETDPEFERIMEQSRRESAATFAATASTWTCARRTRKPRFHDGWHRARVERHADSACSKAARGRPEASKTSRGTGAAAHRARTRCSVFAAPVPCHLMFFLFGVQDRWIAPNLDFLPFQKIRQGDFGTALAIKAITIAARHLGSIPSHGRHGSERDMIGHPRRSLAPSLSHGLVLSCSGR